jgi:hypothetical protein
VCRRPADRPTDRPTCRRRRGGFWRTPAARVNISPALGESARGVQLQLIYGFADYFAAAPCVRLPSSLTRTHTHSLAQTKRSIVCCASVIVRARVNSRRKSGKHTRAAKSSCRSHEARPDCIRPLFAQPPPLTSTRKFRLRDALPGLIKNTEC